jgi:hypothetical protein
MRRTAFHGVPGGRARGSTGANRPADRDPETHGNRQEEKHMANFDYDVVIIGSGFGGSVAALRAAEKGVALLLLPVSRKRARRREASALRARTPRLAKRA